MCEGIFDFFDRIVHSSKVDPSLDNLKHIKFRENTENTKEASSQETGNVP